MEHKPVSGRTSERGRGWDEIATLHQSGATRVVRAQCREQNRPVILKMPASDGQDAVWAERYAREAAILESLRHPRIVPFIALASADRRPVLLFEDVGAVGLDVWLAEQPRDLGRRLQVAVQMAEAVAAVHEAGVIHHDLALANFLIRPSDLHVMLADFGLATRFRREWQAPVMAEHLQGTLAYLAPEQTGRIRRAVDARADLYGLGVALYQLLTGHLPFAAATPLGWVHQHLTVTPKPPHEVDPAIDPALSAVVMHLLAKDPENRYQTARGVCHDLERCAHAEQAGVSLDPQDIGVRDRLGLVRTEGRLYGREGSWSEVERAWTAVCAGGAEFWLVLGAEGSGKTRFLEEAKSRLALSSGWAIGAGYRPDLRAVPYAGWIAALDDVLMRILELPDAELDAWQARLVNGLGPEARHLTILSHWGALTGMDAQVGPAPSGQELHRVLRTLVELLAGPDHPVLLTLDDLQWADEESLALLADLLAEGNVTGLLILGAARPDADAGRLTAARARWRESVAYGELALRPLTVSDIARWTAHSLSTVPERVEDLARAIAAKTGGQPLFVSQFLHTLVQRQVLAFDAGTGRWKWSLTAIDRLPMTDNVAQMLLQDLPSLTPSARRVLDAMACAGSALAAGPLASALDLSTVEVGAAMEPLEARGLVEVVWTAGRASGSQAESGIARRPRFRLAHARVQEAVYQALPEGSRLALHRRLALALEGESASGEEADPDAFGLARHFNAAGPALVGDDERVRAARANLNAAQQARRTGSFAAAWEFLAAGVAHLPASAWQTEHELTWTLFQTKLRTEVALHRLDEALATGDVLQSHARTLAESLETAGPIMNVYTVRGDAESLRRLSRRWQRAAGITVPRRLGMAAARRQYRRVLDLVGDRTPDQLLAEVPVSDDALLGSVMGLLVMAANAGGHNRAWVAYHQLKLMELSLQHGWHGRSVIGFFGFAPLMDPGNRTQLDQAYDFGWAGMQLAHRLQDDNALLNARGLFGMALSHWRHPLSDTVSYLQWYHEYAHKIGAAAYAYVQSPGWVLARLLAGEDLPVVVAHARSMLVACREHGLPMPEATLRAIVAPLERWHGGDAEAAPSPGGADPEAMLQDPDLMLTQAYLGALASLLADDHAAALRHAAAGRSIISTETIDFVIPELRFLEAVALARGDVAGTLGVEQRRRLNRLTRMLTVWAESCPANYGGKLALVQALRQEAAGRGERCGRLFEEAIAGLAAAGFPVYEGLAHQQAARWHREAGRGHAAIGHLLAARRVFGRWGADRIVAELDARHAELSEWLAGAGTPAHEGGVGSRTASTGDVASLDVETVVRTAQAISATIQLDQLLTLILAMAMENAGADRGALVLERDGQWFVDVAQDVAGGSDGIPTGLPVARSPYVSRAVIQYALRTQETVLVDDVATDARFGRDPSLGRRGVRSVLCLPVVKQGTTVAVLYLENRLMVRAFTPERVGLLEMLAGQAAVSLENARLVEHLEERVRVRTAELEETLENLRRAQRQMVETEKMASLGQLTAGVAHEINNPVNFMVSSVPSLRRDIEDVLDVVARYREGAARGDWRAAETLAETLDLPLLEEEIRQLLQGIEEGSRRTAEIVRGLRSFSRVDEGDVKPIDVREGLESTLMLLKKQYHPRIAVERDYGEVPPVECYPGQINQVFMNLLVNAIQAISDTGRIRIQVRAEGDEVVMRFQDSGPGIPPEIVSRIFEPFFTTKPVGVGTGLGLSISYGIIQRHHGTMTVETEPGRGTTFTVRMPIRQPASTTSA